MTFLDYGVNNTDREIKKREADLKKQPPVLYQDDSDEDDASSVYMRRKNYYEVPNLVGDGFEGRRNGYIQIHVISNKISFL